MILLPSSASTQLNSTSTQSKAEVSFILRQIQPPTHPGVYKTGIRGIQDTRQIVHGKTNDIENNHKKGGSKPLT